MATNYKKIVTKVVPETPTFRAQKNKRTALGQYNVVVDGPVVIDNLGKGPKGQRSKAQIKKVPFKGTF